MTFIPVWNFQKLLILPMILIWWEVHFDSGRNIIVNILIIIIIIIVDEYLCTG